MRKRIAGALAALFALVVPMLAAAQPAHAATGLHVSNGRLVEAGGSDFVMRGVSHAHTWYPTHLDALDDIKALGANTVRVVLSSGDLYTKNDTADVADVVSRCKADRLICVLEVHDTTGYGESSGAVSLSRAADYWAGVKSALDGQEDYVVINIGNEPYGNTNTGAWTNDTANAIRKMRAAGFHHTLMVDAPNWGQDWSFTMRDNARTVFSADPEANTVFSVHMYGVFNTAAKVSDYLNRFVSAKLPVVVGEFGWKHTDGDPDEDAIMSTAQSLGLGYLGWSWSGNGGGVEYLDMATGFGASRLTSWGQRVFNGANGIRSTAKEASVYSGTGGGGTDTTPPTAPGAPVVTATTSSSVSLSWGAATDDTGVAGYDVYRGGAKVGSTAGTSYTDTGLTASTAYAYTVKARDAAGNTSPASAAVTATTQAGSTGGGDPGCTASFRVDNQWSGGFIGIVTVKNTGTAPTKGWKVTWTFGGDQRIVNSWNATVVQSGASVSAANVDYNASVAPGASTDLGFQANVTGPPGTLTPVCTAG
ncbi:cellulase family glycosylhydrolase [Streptomyces sp. NPDC001380]|uniref:cellulase family glycosylhydrolase n=1 Tax=Streptomyces sp. NPDC001380 TaxID=3364566 RepID=UPI0036B8A8F2